MPRTPEEIRKNIVNPEPGRYTDPSSTVLADVWESLSAEDIRRLSEEGFRSGANYDYNNPRNKWVLEATHMLLLTMSEFPRIYQSLTPLGPLDPSNLPNPVDDDPRLMFTFADALAYAAAYPQNAVVKLASLLQILHMALPSEQQKQQALEEIAATTGVKKLLTVTTAAAQRPENQTAINDPAGATGAAAAAQLPAIPLAMTFRKYDLLMKTMKGPDYSQIPTSTPPFEPIEADIIANDPALDGLDLSQWKNNVSLSFLNKLYPQEGQAPPSRAVISRHRKTSGITDYGKGFVYYNSSDDYLYYVERAGASTHMNFDVGDEDNTEVVTASYNALKYNGLLRMVFFYLGEAPANVREVENIITPMRTELERIGRFKVEAALGDPSRPIGAPDAKWLISARVERAALEDYLKRQGLISKLFTDAGDHPVKIFKDLIDAVKPAHRAPYTIAKLKENVKGTSEVLNKYAKAMSDEGVGDANWGGLNLEKESIKLETFLETFNNYITGNFAEWSDLDKVEILLDESFEIQLIIRNGEITIKPTGLGLDIFTETTPRTFAYVFYSKNILRVTSNIGTIDKWQPWLEFIPTYTFPKPGYRPSESESQDVGSSSTSSPQPSAATQAGLAASGGSAASTTSNSQLNSVSNKDSSLIFKTQKMIDDIVSRKLKIGRKDLYNAVKSSAGSCDTDLAKYLSMFFDLYFLVAHKSDYKMLIMTVVSKIKTELVEDEILKAQISQAELYANQPLLVVREIEKKVNEQISCLLDLIGGAIILNLPAGVKPPSVQKLVREVVAPPKGVDFVSKKKKQRSMFGVWYDASEKLLLSFIKQAILHIFKDLVSAMLGCGPGPDEHSWGIGFTKKNDPSQYGVIQINALIERHGDIDLSAIAERIGVEHRKHEVNDNDELEVIIEQPKTDELIQLNDDVSNILLSKETLSLLQGEADDATVLRVIEMIYTERPTDVEGIDEDNLENQIELNKNRDSLKTNDPKYASLTLENPDIVTGYFTEIGNALGGLDLLEPIDPKDDYCKIDDPSPDYGEIELGASPAQLAGQIDQQIAAKLDKAKDLCDMSAAMNLKLEDFLGQWKDPAWYTAFLKWLAWWSRKLQETQADALANQASAVPHVRDLPTYLFSAIFEAANEEYGDNLIAPRMNADNGLFSWRTGDSDEGVSQIEVSFDKTEAHYRYRQGGTPTFVHLFSVPLSNESTGGNTPTIYVENQVVDRYLGIEALPSLNPEDPLVVDPDGRRSTSPPPFFIGGDEVHPNGLSTLFPEHGQFPADWAQRINDLLDLADLQAFGPNLGEESWATATSIRGITEENIRDIRFSALISNQYFNIKRQIATFYATPLGRQRFRKTTRQLVPAAFEPADNDCFESFEELVAKAVLNSIQQRVINFFFNTGPLLSSYVGWNTPDTLNSLVAYLQKKIKEDLTDKGLYNIVLDSMKYIKKVMSIPEGQDASRVKFDISQDSPEEQYDYVVGQIFKQLLFRVGWNKTGYPGAGANLFESASTKRWVYALGEYIKNGIVNTLPRGTLDPPRSKGPYGRSGVDGQLPQVGNSPTLASTVLALDASEVDPNPVLELTRRIDIDGDVHHNPARGTEHYMVGLKNWTENHFLNFVPIPLIQAMNIIYADKVVNIAKVYAPFSHETQRRVAIADDALLTTYNATYLPRFATEFDRFPVTIEGVQYFSEQQAQNQLREFKHFAQEFRDLDRNRQAIIQRLESLYFQYTEAVRIEAADTLGVAAELSDLRHAIQKIRGDMGSVGTLTRADLAYGYIGRRKIGPSVYEWPHTRQDSVRDLVYVRGSNQEGEYGELGGEAGAWEISLEEWQTRWSFVITFIIEGDMLDQYNRWYQETAVEAIVLAAKRELKSLLGDNGSRQRYGDDNELLKADATSVNLNGALPEYYRQLATIKGAFASKEVTDASYVPSRAINLDRGEFTAAQERVHMTMPIQLPITHNTVERHIAQLQEFVDAMMAEREEEDE